MEGGRRKVERVRSKGEHSKRRHGREGRVLKVERTGERNGGREGRRGY